MEIKKAVAALEALAQETRLATFRALVHAGPQGLAAGALAEAVACPASTLSFHLKALSAAGLVRARQEGRFIYYSADFTRMSALLAYLTEHCCKGMPQECFSVVETALGTCCPSSERKCA
jgi:ArsR family transcriptional regulator, arsenate/arsenite/antimonite-responsive transcriptional repressor